MVTSAPAAAAMNPSSNEMKPPPMKRIRPGSDSIARKSSLEEISPSPGIESARGIEPVAIPMNRAVTRSSPIRSSFLPANRARPWRRTTPSFASVASRLAVTTSVNPRLNRIRSLHSMRQPPAIPVPLRCRARMTVSAAPCSTFFGTQPRWPQVPPYGSSSVIATLQPSRRQRRAMEVPAAPVPITTRSKSKVPPSSVPSAIPAAPDPYRGPCRCE